MNLLNKTKAIFGLIAVLILSAMVSCARLTTPVVPLAGFTPTPTRTATASTSGSTLMWDDFDEGPWVGWSNSGGNGYLVTMYMQNGTFNNGTQNTTIHQSGTASLDLNVNFTSATGNLLETTIENGVMYGASVDETTGGVNPGQISFWVNPSVAMQMYKIWIDAPSGANTGITNTTILPAGVWTNVVQSLAGVPAGAMRTTEAVILDMTCPTTGVVDVRIDSIGFVASTVTVTPTATATITPTSTITNTPTITSTPTFTTTPYTSTPTPAATPTSNVVWDDFDEVPWVGWTNTGAEGFLVSIYTQNATFNGGSLNTTTYQGGNASLDLNTTFTSATSNLLEATFENGVSYGSTVNEQVGSVNPSYVSFWVNPTTTMQTTKVWINFGGTNYPINNAVSCPAHTWTNVLTSIPGSMPAMTNVKAVILDLTCGVAATLDCNIDGICFYP
jgi:hypothetical protein